MLNLDSNKYLGEKIDSVSSRFDMYPLDDRQVVMLAPQKTLGNIPTLIRSFATESKKRNIVTFYEWVGSAKVPALPSVLRLYKHLIDKKVKIVFLTGSSDAYTKAREDNLKSVGYTTWDKLILRSKDDYDKGLRGAIFKLAKRKELEEKDPKHRIIGNMGDQWSDLIGTNIRLLGSITNLRLVDTWHQELFSAQTNFLVQRAKLWNSHVYYVASGMSKKISLDQIIKRMLRVHLV
ncbi:hypothetical protein LguiB_011264 [Lonicera macranthoides]